MPYALKSPRGRIHWETIDYYKSQVWIKGDDYLETVNASEEKGWRAVKVAVVEVKQKKKGK